MRREGRIPHRRACVELVQGYNGVTGAPEEVWKLNYFVLDKQGTNHSKCRRPSYLLTHYPSEYPKWKAKGKAKGQGKARRKDCLSNPLIPDFELESPSSKPKAKAKGKASREDCFEDPPLQGLELARPQSPSSKAKWKAKGQGKVHRKDFWRKPVLPDLELARPYSPQTHQIAAQISESEDETFNPAIGNSFYGGYESEVSKRVKEWHARLTERSSMLIALRQATTDADSWPVDETHHLGIVAVACKSEHATSCSAAVQVPGAVECSLSSTLSSSPDLTACLVLAQLSLDEPSDATLEATPTPTTPTSEGVVASEDSDWEMLSESDSWDIVSTASMDL